MGHLLLATDGSGRTGLVNITSETLDWFLHSDSPFLCIYIFTAPDIQKNTLKRSTLFWKS